MVGKWDVVVAVVEQGVEMGAVGEEGADGADYHAKDHVVRVMALDSLISLKTGGKGAGDN